MTDNKSVPYTHNDFDNCPWPVIITDTHTKITHKNLFCTRASLFRVGSCTEKLIRAYQRNDYRYCVKEGITKMFECVPMYGFTHAITIRISDTETAVMFAPDSYLAHFALEANEGDNDYAAYRSTEKLVKFYRKMCEDLRQRADPETVELLTKNALRLARAEHHFSMYLMAATRASNTEQPLLCNFTDLCNGMITNLRHKLSPLGYRMAVKFTTTYPMAMVNKKLFVVTFLTIMTLALRISTTHELQITVSESALDRIINFTYSFKSGHIDTSNITFAAEMNFIKTICEAEGWNFTGIYPLDTENTVMRLTIPTTRSEYTTVFSPAFREECIDADILRILDEEASVFYFNFMKI